MLAGIISGERENDDEDEQLLISTNFAQLCNPVMVLTSLLGSTLLRTQRSHFPPVFRRYKSLTAAIERGRQGGPDRPFRPRTGAPPERPRDADTTNRRERRFERFGSPKDGQTASPFGDRPRRDGSERHSTFGRSRDSGRVGPPRSRDDAPSRFREDRNEGSSRTWDRPTRRREVSFGEQREDTPDRRQRYDGKPSSAGRFEGRERSEYRGEGRESRFGRFDRAERPAPRRRESDAGGRRPFERSGRSNDRPDRASHRAPRDSFAEDAPSGLSRRDGFQGDRSSTRPARPFERRDGPSSDPRERPARDQNERYGRREPSENEPERSSQTGENKGTVRGPESLPYTTAASEFIYGFSSVIAAIRANRRKLYKIYIHSRGISRDGLLGRIRALKLFPITEEVGDEYLRAMDKASSGRPHNGVILESSPLPVPPITELKTASMEDATFGVSIGAQTAEDALVNGKQESYSYRAAGWRHPLVLYVDGVVSASLIIGSVVLG